jgi:hypothetical protein
MIPVPADQKDILKLAGELIEQCRVSVAPRMAYYRLMNAIAETGRYDGMKSLINMLYKHLDRMQAHLYSPTQLKLTVDFEHKYPKNVQQRGQVVGETLTRQWERSNTDITFGLGVMESLKYGACLLKQWTEVEDDKPTYQHKLVQPWQFGVYREDENSLDKQEVVCETITMTLPEVWKRIWQLPKAAQLFDRIKAHAQTGVSTNEPTSFFHQVLSTSQLNTGLQGSTSPVPGGIVSLGNDPNYPIMSPVIAAPVIQLHELWVKDDIPDYTTIQMVEPDILIAPLFKKSNLLIKDSKLHPYRLIQPNIVANWFWGRSELVDLIEPQSLLSQTCDDLKRLFGLQIDKLLYFIGENTITDELYSQMRMAGFGNLGQGSDVKDMTPKFPQEGLPWLKLLMDVINMLGGFPETMQGKGDQGVRSGGHAEFLQKMASPQLKDRSLIVERQCAGAADLTLSLMEAKDAQRYWTKADTMADIEQTTFLLSDLPDDWRVTVDSHSTSPVFADEHAQLLFALRKEGDVDGEYMLDNLPVPHREAAKIALREREAKQAELLKAHPELLEKMFAGKKK